jgi:hypothetical protein
MGRVDYLGGAAIRFVPPGHAGPATILRIPPPSVWHENLPAGMLGGLGEEFNGQCTWLWSWDRRESGLTLSRGLDSRVVQALDRR